MFSRLFDQFIWPWAPTIEQFLAQVFLESGPSSQSLNPLIGFLTYLEPKLWLKTTNW